MPGPPGKPTARPRKPLLAFDSKNQERRDREAVSQRGDRSLMPPPPPRTVRVTPGVAGVFQPTAEQLADLDAVAMANEMYLASTAEPGASAGQRELFPAIDDEQWDDAEEQLEDRVDPSTTPVAPRGSPVPSSSSGGSSPSRSSPGATGGTQGSGQGVSQGSDAVSGHPQGSNSSDGGSQGSDGATPPPARGSEDAAAKSPAPAAGGVSWPRALWKYCLRVVSRMPQVSLTPGGPSENGYTFSKLTVARPPIGKDHARHLIVSFKDRMDEYGEGELLAWRAVHQVAGEPFPVIAEAKIKHIADPDPNGQSYYAPFWFQSVEDWAAYVEFVKDTEGPDGWERIMDPAIHTTCRWWHVSPAKYRGYQERAAAQFARTMGCSKAEILDNWDSEMRFARPGEEELTAPTGPLKLGPDEFDDYLRKQGCRVPTRRSADGTDPPAAPAPVAAAVAAVPVAAATRKRPPASRPKRKASTKRNRRSSSGGASVPGNPYPHGVSPMMVPGGGMPYPPPPPYPYWPPGYYPPPPHGDYADGSGDSDAS